MFKKIRKCWDWLWWRYMPGETVSVRWPVGDIEVTDKYPRSDRDLRQFIKSADPNDHYRPWLESNVGRQGWDWNWNLVGDDLTNNRISIKFRRDRAHWATIAALRWA